MYIKEAYKIVGDKKELLKSLIDSIEINYQPQIKFTFSKKSGWTVFFRKNRKSLCYIDLRENGFSVIVVIGASLNDEIEKAKISKNTKKMFTNAKQYFDGKWLNFDVKTESQIDDIKSLLLIKKKPVSRL